MPTTRPTRFTVAKRWLPLLLGLTLSVAACKSAKEEATATPTPAAQETVAAQTPAPEAPASEAASTSDAPAKTMATQARRGGGGSDAAAGAEIKARKPPQPGLVWVNTKNGVYHTESSPHYGKTAQGQWMKESKARARGYRPVGAPKPAAPSDQAASGSDSAHKASAH